MPDRAQSAGDPDTEATETLREIVDPHQTSFGPPHKTGFGPPHKTGFRPFSKTPDETALIYANGVHATTGKYLLEPMTAKIFADRVRRQRLEVPASNKALRADLDGEDLAQAGWGIVFGSGVGPEVREALAPLLELRRSQAGELYRDDLIYYGGTWEQFLADNDAGLGVVDPRNVPYYLLLVGDPQEFSFEFQCLLDVQHAVGRLSFETADGYARYVEGVLAVERGDVARSRRADVFGVRNWDDPATILSDRYLVRPLVEAIEKQDDWQVRSWLRDGARKSQLSQLLGGPETSSLLLTAGHAVGFAPDDKAQMESQGGLLCYDWPGPEEWQGKEISPDFYFAARDVPDAADVRGLISFHFACYSAGTPRLDAFSRASGKDIQQIAPHDFVAALPRRLLGHPRGGALAVIGHVDQAFPHSFLWHQESSQITHFDVAFKQLMRGKPVGLALEAFGQRHATIAAAITQHLERQRETGEEGAEALSDDGGDAFRWIAHNDARNYVLLGDPAVRLPAQRSIEER